MSIWNSGNGGPTVGGSAIVFGWIGTVGTGDLVADGTPLLPPMFATLGIISVGGEAILFRS